MTKQNIHIAIADYGSPQYGDALALRHRYLRAPLRMEFTEAELDLDRLATHFIAFNDSGVIGCVIGQPQGNTVKIRQMVVAEAYRRNALGTQLIKAAEAHFTEAGIFHFTMHAREDIIPFYENLGYEKQGKAFIEIGIVHQRLDKALPPQE